MGHHCVQSWDKWSSDCRDDNSQPLPILNSCVGFLLFVKIKFSLSCLGPDVLFLAAECIPTNILYLYHFPGQHGCVDLHSLTMLFSILQHALFPHLLLPSFSGFTHCLISPIPGGQQLSSLPGQDMFSHTSSLCTLDSLFLDVYSFLISPSK